MAVLGEGGVPYSANGPAQGDKELTVLAYALATRCPGYAMPSADIAYRPLRRPVFGSNFGVIDYTLSTTIGESECKQSYWISDTSVYCATDLKQSYWISDTSVYCATAVVMMMTPRMVCTAKAYGATRHPVVLTKYMELLVLTSAIMLPGEVHAVPRRSQSRYAPPVSVFAMSVTDIAYSTAVYPTRCPEGGLLYLISQSRFLRSAVVRYYPSVLFYRPKGLLRCTQYCPSMWRCRNAACGTELAYGATSRCYRYAGLRARPTAATPRSPSFGSRV
eukprot:3003229-Rhodomonas_salina.1